MEKKVDPCINVSKIWIFELLKVQNHFTLLSIYIYFSVPRDE